jgi:hypothetical protein
MYPLICLDNFFNDTNKVLKFANSLQYYESDFGKWPGKRSKPINDVDKCFFNTFGLKVLSILYPCVNDIYFTCNLTFQKISKDYSNEGWIHQDLDSDFTAIVYLSNHKNCGTSFFDSKEPFATSINDEEKKQSYLNKEFTKSKECLKQNNEQFYKTVDISSKFNRIIIFKGAYYHAAQKFYEENLTEERLTLIGFFSKIYFEGIKFNGVEHLKY